MKMENAFGMDKNNSSPINSFQPTGDRKSSIYDSRKFSRLAPKLDTSGKGTMDEQFIAI